MDLPVDQLYHQILTTMLRIGTRSQSDSTVQRHAIEQQVKTAAVSMQKANTYSCPKRSFALLSLRNLVSDIVGTLA